MAADFTADLNAFRAKAEANVRRVFMGSVFEAHKSIIVGSPITGAPGQPVDTGTLRNSYQISWDAQSVATIASKIKHAATIEAGARLGKQLVLRSKVGGFGSVRITVAGFQRIVDYVTDKEAKK